MPPIPPVTYAILFCLVAMIAPYNVLSLQHVFTRPIAENVVTFCWISQTWRRRILRPGMRREPFLPPGPPGTLMQRGLFEPFGGRAIRGRVLPRQLAKAPARMHRTTDDAGIVAAARQYIGVVAGSGQPTRLVGRLPRRDMIGLRAKHHHGHNDGLEVYRSPVDFEAPVRQVVLKVQLLQVLAVHAPGHARAVAVPSHQVVELLALAL